MAFLVFAPSDQYLFVPDKARPVDPLIRVEGEKPSTSGEDGGVYMVDILIRKASRIEALFPSLASDGTLVPADALNPAGVSEEDRRQEGKNQMSRSQEIAAAVALEHLGYDIDVKGEGAQIDTVVPGRPADGVLEVGDVIVEAGGEPVKGHADLVKALGEVEPGDDIEIVVLRDGKRTPVTVGTSESPEDPDQAVTGIIVADAATFDLPVDVSIDAGSIGGPSAGLAFALGIVDELGDDIDDGRTVVVTGRAGPRRDGDPDRRDQAEDDRREGSGRGHLHRPGRERRGGAQVRGRARDRRGVDLRRGDRALAKR